jgi:dienelactone hydrolase
MTGRSWAKSGTGSKQGRRARPHDVLACCALVASVLVAAACVPMPPEPATGPSPNDAPEAAVPAYVGPGPWAVGVTTISLGDRDMEVWYPADPADTVGVPRDQYFIRDFVSEFFDGLLDPAVDPPYETDAHRGVPADPSGGPYPLVLFSHGFAGFRLTTTFLTTHLASWGFVVIAPDYLERGLASVLGDPVPSPRSDRVVADEAITAAAEANDEAGGPLEGIIDSSEVFPIGHSAGGGTSLRLLTRPDVNTAIPMASGISEISLIQGNAPVLPPSAAITFIAGRADGIADVANARTGYEYTPGPGRLVELDRAGHNNAFTELCEIGDGGVAAIARGTGLPIPENLLALGDDGCPTPPFAPSPEVWDEVRHFVTAELRFRAGLDADPVGLGDGIVAAFDDVLTYRHDP